jgi:hypothetical protein
MKSRLPTTAYAHGCAFRDLSVNGCTSTGIHAGTGLRRITIIAGGPAGHATDGRRRWRMQSQSRLARITAPIS